MGIWFVLSFYFSYKTAWLLWTFSNSTFWCTHNYLTFCSGLQPSTKQSTGSEIFKRFHICCFSHFSGLWKRHRKRVSWWYSRMPIESKRRIPSFRTAHFSIEFTYLWCVFINSFFYKVIAAFYKFTFYVLISKGPDSCCKFSLSSWQQHSERGSALFYPW